MWGDPGTLRLSRGLDNRRASAHSPHSLALPKRAEVSRHWTYSDRTALILLNRKGARKPLHEGGAR